MVIQRDYFVLEPPGCGCGFMSVERMRHFLNLETVSFLISTSQRQQISPEMKFTCDGMITKWIIGAESVMNGNLNPELQVWRNSENETYRKINGTLIEYPVSQSGIVFYEYNNFPPIPVKSGDILGIFIPPHSSSRLSLVSERTTTPTQYVVPTDDFIISPYNVINIENNMVRTRSYHPLVSVEFSK